jgi:hypothetical protein
MAAKCDSKAAEKKESGGKVSKREAFMQRFVKRDSKRAPKR